MDDYFFPIIDENINPCRGCLDYGEDGCKSNGGCGRPPTNADRIRSMTDEELADEILSWFNWLNAVEWDDKRIIEWLKQEVSTNG
jgi:hypothetical protein